MAQSDLETAAATILRRTTAIIGKTVAGGSLPGKLQALALTTLIFFSAIIGYATVTKGHDWGDDFASYIMQAQSIVEETPNRFVEENRFAIEKSTRPLGPVA